MGKTLEASRSFLANASNEITRLEEEIKKLREERKNQGLFLDVKKEQEALETARIEKERIYADAKAYGDKVMDDAQKSAESIISAAHAEADFTVEEAKGILRQAGEKKKESENGVKEADMLKEKALSLSADANARMINLAAKEAAFNRSVTVTIEKLTSLLS